MSMVNTMAEMMEQMEQSFRVPRRGELVRGKIVLVSDSEVVVNIGYKSDGVIPRSEFSDGADSALQENDEIEAMVTNLDDGNGNVQLSIKRMKMQGDWTELEAFYTEEKDVDVKVAQITKGGVIAFYKEVRGFIPASQLSFRHVDKLDEFIGQTLQVKVIEFNRKRNKVVFSRRDMAMAERAVKLTATWEKIQVGQKIAGEVKRITDFGAFVDLGGVDGLIHATEISWGRSEGIKNALKIGDKVEAVVIAADQAANRISLSIKQLTTDPWAGFGEKYNLEDTFDGKVVSLVDFGAFVELEPGVEGLVHISQIAKKRVEKPADELKVGDLVKVKVLEADSANRKLKLSIKAAL